MKRILLVLIVATLFFSCGESKKEEEQTAEKKVTKKTVVKKPKKEKKPTVIVDENGVANVFISTSDKMKFSTKEINVKPNQKVKLTLTHTGKLDKKIMGHNVVILKQGVKMSTFAAAAAASKENDYIPESSDDVIVHTKMIGGGESTTIEFTAPAAGEYDFICSFPAHFAMMKGKFIVK